MSNTLSTTSVASEIIEALAQAKNINETNKADSAEAKARANLATLRGYAIAAVAIRQLLDQELWTTGKQKKGVVSASAALKDALVTEAKQNDISPSKAKRLIEKAAAIVVPGTKTHISAVHVAAANSVDEVAKAMAGAGITKEIDILRHVDPPVTDVVARIMKAISKLEGADRKGFVKEIVSHEIIDDILPEAEATTAEERENARKAKAAAGKKPVVDREAQKRARDAAKAEKEKAAAAKKEEAEKKKAEAQAKKAAKENAGDADMAVPKSGGSKKGAMTKAKEEAVSDPFSN